MVEPYGSMLQGTGIVAEGQVEFVPDPKTAEYGVFSIAMITMLSNVVPVRGFVACTTGVTGAK